MIKYCDILKENEKSLRESSVLVHLPLSKEDEETMLKMQEYLDKGYDTEFAEQNDIRPGVGLAAPQIGINKQMFVILGVDENLEWHNYGVINPKIISESTELTYLPGGEGCLSVDRAVEGLVHRPKRIKVRCDAFDFETHETFSAVIQLKNYMAVVFQHEYDHLYGRLFFDRIDKKNPFFVPTNSTPIVFKEDIPEEDEK